MQLVSMLIPRRSDTEWTHELVVFRIVFDQIVAGFLLRGCPVYAISFGNFLQIRRDELRWRS